MSHSKNLIKRRMYRERLQDSRRRQKYPFLEKKQDWRVRSRRYKTQQRLIGHLAEKARTRNAEEFSFRMLKAKQVGGGVDKLRSKNAGQTFLLTPEQAAFAQSSAQILSRRGQAKIQERRKGRRKREAEACRLDQKLVDLKRQTLRKRIEKTLTHAAVLAGQADPRGGQSVSLEDSDGDARGRARAETESELEDQSEEEAESGEEAESEGEQETESEGEEETESEEEGRCRWLSRQRGGQTKTEEEGDSSSASDGESSDADSADFGSSDEEPLQSRKADKKKAGANLAPRTWLESLEQDTLHARRLSKLAAKLQLKSDLAGKGRRKLVSAGHSGAPSVYKWATERKK
uniref:Utp11 n=1 Tax=Toxoplasma gondii COUG TaxID=1074873 RepID=A0A2G8Y209_TOXGO|nr:Utp11 [Toxoplasma gondii COUG]